MASQAVKSTQHHLDSGRIPRGVLGKTLEEVLEEGQRFANSFSFRVVLSARVLSEKTELAGADESPVVQSLASLLLGEQEGGLEVGDGDLLPLLDLPHGAHLRLLPSVHGHLHTRKAAVVHPRALDEETMAVSVVQVDPLHLRLWRTFWVGIVEREKFLLVVVSEFRCDEFPQGLSRTFDEDILPPHHRPLLDHQLPLADLPLGNQPLPLPRNLDDGEHGDKCLWFSTLVFNFNYGFHQWFSLLVLVLVCNGDITPPSQLLEANQRMEANQVARQACLQPTHAYNGSCRTLLVSS